MGRSFVDIFSFPAFTQLTHSLTFLLFQSPAAVDSEASRGLLKGSIHRRRHLQSTISGFSGGTGTASGTGALNVGDMGGAGSSSIMSTFNSGGFSSGMLFGPDGAVAGQSSGGTSGAGGGVGTVIDSMMMAAGVLFTGSSEGSGLGTFGGISSPVNFATLTPTGPTGGFGGGVGALEQSAAATGTGVGTDVSAFGNGMNFGSGSGQGINIIGTAGGMGAGANTGAASGTGMTVDGVFSSNGSSMSDFNTLGQGFFGGGPFTFNFP